ncbi:unnamed protein product [Phyllotreta striolata]|uniref:Protein grindelwald n=1 Tax=Phyllotreta striolata TaxID=444603 RepID=A0A9N9TUG9_PHYSR|nr:unnamed protein product [Phyllotreta striolata]
MLCTYLFVVLLYPLVKSDGLSASLSVKCGVRNCSLDQYCSDFGTTCESCAVICDPTGINFSKSTCEKSCQTYLHDIRYVSKNGGGSSGSNDLKSRVDKLSQLVSVSLSLTILMLLVLICFLCFQFYRWKDKKNITLASLKQKIFGKRTDESQRPNNVSELDVRKGDLKLDMPSSNMSHSEHSPVTVTTSISRRPAEDSTLDYAYDNPALTASR